MPKQRNPFLFRNNSSEISQARDLARRIDNLRRAPINVANRIVNINIEKAQKPKPHSLPLRAAAGAPASGQLLTAIFDWDTGTPQIYEILADDSVQLLETTGFPAGFGWGVYVHLTWAGGYWWMTGYDDTSGNIHLYRSADALTWEFSLDLNDVIFCYDPIYDGQNFYMGKHQETLVEFPNRKTEFWILKSSDNGVTWEEVYYETVTSSNYIHGDLLGSAVNPSNTSQVAFLWEWDDNPTGFQHMGARIIVSNDGGSSWSAYNLPFSLTENHWLGNTGPGHNMVWLDDGTLIFCTEGRGDGPIFPDPGSSDVVYGFKSTNPTGGIGTWSTFEIFDIRDYGGDGWGSGSDPINGGMQIIDDKLICTYGPGDSSWPGPAGSGSLSFWSEDRGLTWSVIETPWTSWMCSNAWYRASTNKIYVVAENTFGDDLVWLLSAEWGSTVFTPVHSFGSRFDLNCWYGICTAESNA